VLISIIEKILLDAMPKVASADNEIRQAVVQVALHDVPEDRSSPDLDHGLRPRLGLF
jgi:hypothetical protein